MEKSGGLDLGVKQMLIIEKDTSLFEGIGILHSSKFFWNTFEPRLSANKAFIDSIELQSGYNGVAQIQHLVLRCDSSLKNCLFDHRSLKRSLFVAVGEE